MTHSPLDHKAGQPSSQVIVFSLTQSLSHQSISCFNSSSTSRTTKGALWFNLTAIFLRIFLTSDLTIARCDSDTCRLFQFKFRLKRFRLTRWSTNLQWLKQLELALQLLGSASLASHPEYSSSDLLISSNKDFIYTSKSPKPSWLIG